MYKVFWQTFTDDWAEKYYTKHTDAKDCVDRLIRAFELIGHPSPKSKVFITKINVQ